MPFPLRFTSPFWHVDAMIFISIYIYIYVHSTLHSGRQPSSCSYVACPSAHCTWRVISAVQEREKPIAWPPWLRSSSSQDCSPWRVEISYGLPEAILKLGFEMWCKFGFWLSHHPEGSKRRPWKPEQPTFNYLQCLSIFPGTRFATLLPPKWPTCRDQVLERVLLSTSTLCCQYRPDDVGTRKTDCVIPWLNVWGQYL